MNLPITGAQAGAVALMHFWIFTIAVAITSIWTPEWTNGAHMLLFASTLFTVIAFIIANIEYGWIKFKN